MDCMFSIPLGKDASVIFGLNSMLSCCVNFEPIVVFTIHSWLWDALIIYTKIMIDTQEFSTVCGFKSYIYIHFHASSWNGNYVSQTGTRAETLYRILGKYAIMSPENLSKARKTLWYVKSFHIWFSDVMVVILGTNFYQGILPYRHSFYRLSRRFNHLYIMKSL